MSERRLAILAWLTVCVVWGTTYLAIAVALESFPVALLAGFRWLTAGTLLAVGARLAGHRLPPPRTWPSFVLLGVLMNVMGNGFVVWAEQHVASGLTAVLIATQPFWALGVERAHASGERLPPRALVGLAIGFSGIVVLVWPELTMGGSEGRTFLLGVLALQAACLGWALGTSYTKRHGELGHPVTASAMQMLFAGVMLIGIGTLRGEWAALSFAPRATAAMAYLVLAGSLLAYTSYVYALKHLPISTVSLYAYINPVIAVVLGTLLLGEPFGPRLLVAAALVLVGVAVVRTGGGGRTTSQAGLAGDDAPATGGPPDHAGRAARRRDRAVA
jgi:drug/metabolite transporter (DMT)-like permease